MEKQKVLVAGASGMLGAAVVRRLLAANHGVVALVRRGARFRRPIPGVSESLRIVEVPAIERRDLKDALGGVEMDAIVNCIGAGVDPRTRDSDSLWHGNVTPVTELISYAASAGIRRIIHTGSEAEYGRAVPGRRITEDHPVLPFSSYGAAKAASVSHAAGLVRKCRVELLVLRPFYLFGPGERDHRLLPTIVAAKETGRPVQLSSGEQVRDPLYVDDAAEAYVAALSVGWPAQVTACNLCSGNPIRVREIAELAAESFGVPQGLLQWGVLPDRETDAAWIVGDPARLRQLTGWQPSMTLEQGIERWMRDRVAPELDAVGPARSEQC